MEIDDRYQNFNESDSDDQSNFENLIDISESEIIHRNKSKKVTKEKINYNSFQLSSRLKNNQYRTISISSDESNSINFESSENDSLLQTSEQNRNKIQLNPIRE